MKKNIQKHIIVIISGILIVYLFCLQILKRKYQQQISTTHKIVIMTESICNCHCGTRIDLDEQLLEERELWKQKYLCLQKQVKVDIQTLKENIYAECSNIMQQEFSSRQASHNKIVNNKNIEIKDLISKVISLETKVKILDKEKQIANYRIKQLEAELEQNSNETKVFQNKVIKVQRQWENRHETALADLRKRIANGSKDQIQKLELEKQHLTHKVKEFENRYQKIIPQVQKIKNALQSKTTQLDDLQTTLQKLKKGHEQRILGMKQQYEDLQKMHSLCPKHLKNSQNKKQQLQRQLEKFKKINREVRVEAVYIDRPVEVERVVQRIIQVEKVVKKYIDNPNSERIQELEQQIKRLRNQLNSVLGQIKEIEEHYSSAVEGLQNNNKVHEQNTFKYKKQRQNLAHRISEQNKQIQLLQDFIEKFGTQKSRQNDGEKVVVHVKQDGTYQKHVEKIPVIPTNQSSKRKR